jgi:hypothetical protein
MGWSYTPKLRFELQFQAHRTHIELSRLEYWRMFEMAG